MPMYEYETSGKGCCHCLDGFAVLQPMGEPPLETCPRCGGDVHKVVSPVAVIRNHLSASNLKEKGFRKLVRRDAGVYEDVT